MRATNAVLIGLTFLLVGMQFAPAFAEVAQEPTHPVSSANQRATPNLDKALEIASAGQKKLTASSPAELAESSTAIPAYPSETVVKDPATLQRYLVTMQRYYDYRSDGYAY